jgi:hypothetical protein
MFLISGQLFQYQESQIQIPLGSGHLCGIPRDILDKGLPISDNPLYISRSLCYEMKSGASFGLVLSIGAVLFAILPNILPLQQHLAMAQLVPGSTPAPPPPTPVIGNKTAELTNTTAGAPAIRSGGAQPSCPPHCNN